jgi:hypothetical protein
LLTHVFRLTGLFAPAAPCALSATFIIGRNEIGVAYAKRAREFK